MSKGFWRRSGASRRSPPSVCPDRPCSLCAGRIAGRRKRSPRRRCGDFGALRAHLRGGASGGNEVLRPASHDRRRRACRDRRQPGRRGQRLRAGRHPSAYNVPPTPARARPSRSSTPTTTRTPRPTWRPTARSRPARLHHRQRLLPQGQPERRRPPLPAADAGWAEEISLDLDMVSAVCPNCHILLVEADAARPSTNLGTAVEPGGRAWARVRLEQLRRLARPRSEIELRHTVLQAPRRGDRRVSPATAATA